MCRVFANDWAENVEKARMECTCDINTAVEMTNKFISQGWIRMARISARGHVSVLKASCSKHNPRQRKKDSKVNVSSPMNATLIQDSRIRNRLHTKYCFPLCHPFVNNWLIERALTLYSRLVFSFALDTLCYSSTSKGYLLLLHTT